MREMQKQEMPMEPVKAGLKAERVQQELAARALEARLKAERVQETLARMQGWSLVEGGRAIDRVRELSGPASAADYAGFVLREAARGKQRVQIGLTGNRVVVTILGSSHGGVRGGITFKQLDFAAIVG